jgi:hypothetical protein
MSYYYGAIATTTETLITYEVIDDPYTCQVLSPLSDGEYLTTKSSEAVQYSSLRYTYDECVEALDSDNLNVCSDKNRDDFIISVTGLAANDGVCKDVLLTDGYRFCYGGETEVTIDDATTTATQFPRQLDKPTATFSTTYFFTNSSGSAHTISVPFATDGVKTDFISDSAHSVYVIARSSTDNQQYLFQMSPLLTTAKVLQRVTYNAFYGLVYGNNRVYSYSLTGTSGVIYSYNLLTGAYTNMVVDCSDYISSSSTQYSASTTYRFLSHDKSTDLLYAMCTSDTSVTTSVAVAGQPPVQVTSYVFSFFQVDFSLGTSRVINANMYALNSTDEGAVDPIKSISQVIVSDNVGVAYTGALSISYIAHFI